MYNRLIIGSIVQWLERPAHNGDVIGSNPIGPNIVFKLSNKIFKINNYLYF